MGIFLKGYLMNLALVSSIGMQNLYVFNSALNNRLRKGLLYTLFVWLADTVLTVVAFFGMGALISHYKIVKLIIMLLGSLLVVWIGFNILRSSRSMQLSAGQRPTTIGRAFINAWSVTWANPQAIIDTGLTFGAMRGTLEAGQATPFIIGVLAASFTWFFGTTLVLGLLRERLPKQFLMWVNLISGCIVILYGFYLFSEFIRLLV